MPRPGYRVPQISHGDTLRETFHAIRAELELPEAFPSAVLDEALQAAAAAPRGGYVDMTAEAFVTLDPAGSTDLDQALQIERDGDGHRVRYAIADVPAFVAAGGTIDAEARRRGQTMYAPDTRVPLHPPSLSEGAASLLPGQDRPAFVWEMALDAGGAVTATTLTRAIVRSRAQLDYDSEQQHLDAGGAAETIALLAEVGERRIAQERARGGASLAIPDQEVVPEPGGGYGLRLRPPRPIEDYNAQISLMTGMAAAEIMLAGDVGILRTLPPAPPEAVDQLRLRARALGQHWPEGQPYGEFLRTLDGSDPRQLALLYAAASLFRGAGYTPFDGSAPPPEERAQAAIAAPYAHVTAPLRRLVDRFGLVCCEALAAGREPPAAIRAALSELPELMRRSDRVAGSLQRGCVDAVEAALLTGSVGKLFEAGVVDADPSRKGALVQIVDPPVLARCGGDGLELGTRTQVRLVEADIARRRVRFDAAG